jgi:hypothetical protein
MQYIANLHHSSPMQVAWSYLSRARLQAKQKPEDVDLDQLR